MATTISGATQSGAPSISQPALRDLVAMETLKLRKRLMTKVVFGLMTLGTLGFMSLAYLWVRTADYQFPAERQNDLDALLLPGAFNDASSIISGIGTILIAMLAASVIGSEFGWGTVRVLVSSGVSRSRLLAAKVIALFEAVVLLVVAGLLTGAVGSLAISVIDGHGVSFGWVSAASLGDLAMIVVRLTFILIVPATIAFAVATVSRSLAAGIAVGIGFQIFDSIVTSVLGTLAGLERGQDLLFTNNLAAIDQYNVVGTPYVSSGLPNVWQAVALLTLYSSLLLAAAFIVFRKRDITSGT